jgi:SWI/SNF related-matrix-associated actin-dependent regulator of chromatin subfamily C
MTRLPVKLFLDFKAGGALCVILGTMYRVKTERNWRRFVFTSPNRLDSVAGAFMAIEEALVQARLFAVPTVFIRPDVDGKLALKLVDILKRHKGNVTSSFEDATHVIYPPGSHHSI